MGLDASTKNSDLIRLSFLPEHSPDEGFLPPCSLRHCWTEHSEIVLLVTDTPMWPENEGVFFSVVRATLSRLETRVENTWHALSK